MSGPENTSKTWSPEMLLLTALSEGGTDSYITGMEAAGQRQLIESTSLPTDTSDSDADFVAVGFAFGEPDPGDPIFRPATLPEGWGRKGSDHSMWSYLVDEHGRRRVSVFYKAAFYDRSAFMRLKTVYSYVSELVDADELPVYDDTWCTRETFTAAVESTRTSIAERIEEYSEHAAAGRGEGYFEGRVVELKEELTKLDAWASRVEQATS